MLTLVLSPARSIDVREVAVTQYRISNCEDVLRARSRVIQPAQERGQLPHGFFIAARQVVGPSDNRRTLESFRADYIGQFKEYNNGNRSE